jgi:excisionase family DNA binding protein
MAKMFYTLEEAAQKLGVDEQTVKDMAARNELQQFRDGDKLMFKRDQIDAKSSSGGSSGPIALADSGVNDAIDLRADTNVPSTEDSREATGVSVFDAGEVDLADPMAQTQVTQPVIDDEDLALESVGSGSGLLDLTRESDDTSLGAELLDEIYPGGDTGMGTGTGMAMDSAVGSSGVFDGAISMETGQSGPSGLENLSAGPAAAGGAQAAPVSYEVEESDPAGSGLGAGMLFGVIAAMVIGLVVMIPALVGVDGALMDMIDPLAKPNNVYILGGVLLIVSIVFGVIGMVVGKATDK